jgi:APA family basic amino acid/polyamine antiporter
VSAEPQPSFRVFDATCLIVGIIIGAGLYETAPQIASSVSRPSNVLWLWVLGGLISLSGALCYTELATAYPRDGGDIVYLRRAYGRWAGFLFGWMQLSIVRPGDIAAMAFVFARYIKAVMPSSDLTSAQWASLAVGLFTLINLWGVDRARWTQNVMTVLKLAGLILIIAVGLMGPVENGPNEPLWEGEGMPIGVALVLVLFCYGGWNEMAYVAAEVHDPQRNIVRAMLSGMSAVIGLYLLANFAFLHMLGHGGVARSEHVAVDVLAERMPQLAEIGVALLVAFSALGSLNGQILTGARVSYSAGDQYRFFRWLGGWNTRRQTPVQALLLQMVISLALINALAGFADTLLYTALSVYTFYFFSSLSVIVLRYREPQTARPYRVPGYPWTILVFMAACLFMMRSAYLYRPLIAGISLVILIAGLPLYFLSSRTAAR